MCPFMQTACSLSNSLSHAFGAVQNPDGTLDKKSKHGGCPVISGTKWAANLWIWNKVRLGYTRAPRKAGAGAYDPTAGIGRDRMAKGKAKGTAQGTAAQSNAPDAPQPKVTFVNVDIPGAQLFYNEDQFYGELPPGAPLRFNSFAGHKWAVKDAWGKVVGRYTVDARPNQEFAVSSTSHQHLSRPSSAPKLPPGARPPN